MSGLDGHKVIVSGEFAKAVRKAARKASLAQDKPEKKETSTKKEFSFNWK